jgi:hypothetical protein
VSLMIIMLLIRCVKVRQLAPTSMRAQKNHAVGMQLPKSRQYKCLVTDAAPPTRRANKAS